MKKRIVILTNNTQGLNHVAEDLNTDYEVLVSESCCEDASEGHFEFISSFDLIILDQTVFTKLDPNRFAMLLSINKPLMILSGERGTINEGENDYSLMYVTYPVTGAKLQDHVKSVLDGDLSGQLVNACSNADTVGDEQVTVTQTSSFVDKDKLGVYRAFSAPQAVAEPVYRLEVEQANARTDQYVYEIANHNLVIDGYPILLSPKELELFDCLSKTNHRLVSNEELFEKIWGKEYHFSKQPFLSNLVMKIRKKVCDEYGVLDSIIINRKGVGYKLNDKFVAKS
jgi:DNA-binding response OmpR family regulator